MVKWFLFVLLIPLCFGMMKPIGGISDSQITKITVETELGACVIQPTPVLANKTYATNLQNLKLQSNPEISCKDFWRQGDTMTITNEFTSISVVIESGTNVQMIAPIISAVDEDDVYEEIETERTSVELRNNPVIEKNTSNIVDSPENTQTTPLFEEINLTTIKQATLDDLYYVKSNIESSSDNSTFWIVLILLALLLFIGWELS